LKNNNNISSLAGLCKNIVLCLVLFFIFHSAIGQPNITRPVRKSFILRTMDWGYRIIEGDSAHPRKRYIFPFPIIAYKPETRWILGVSVTNIFRLSNDSVTRPSYARLNIAYSQEKQFSVRPSIECFTKGNKWNIRAMYGYTNFAENFWGLGKNAVASNKELYFFNQHKASLKVANQVLPHLFVGAQYSLEQLYDIRSIRGGLFETSNLVGGTGYLVSGAGLTVYYDNRDHIYFPHNGQIIELSNLFNQKFLGSKYTFFNITLDARKYIHLWKENVLAIQGFMNINEGDIPFRMLGVIGSDVFMRGYYNGRFRDNHAMAFQAELRKTIWGPIGCVVFAGGGTVGRIPSELTSGIKPNIGFGLRVKAIPRERVNVRADWGFGENGINALYIGLNEAF
jgi:outer membrane protein assembly factor BamA